MPVRNRSHTSASLHDADSEETGGRFSSQAGILWGAGHGWIPNPDTWFSSQASILRGAGHSWIQGPDIER